MGDKARKAHAEKMKAEMMTAMGITDPKELQALARGYCKEMAVEASLPSYQKLFMKLNKAVDQKKFESLRTNKEKLAFVFKTALDDEDIIDSFKGYFKAMDLEQNTDLEESAKKRNAGNQAFQKKKDQEAIQLYTEAAFGGIPETEDGKKDCALALANRSAVWVKMNKFNECLEDIEAAVYFDYPQNMLYKLIERQAKCLAALGRTEEAARSYNRAILLLKQSKLEPEKQTAFKKDIDAALAKLKTDPVKPKETYNAGDEPTSLLKTVNKRIPQFSDAVTLSYNWEVGRYGVATRDIEVGEVVMQDTSLISFLGCRFRKTNCTNCLKKLKDGQGFPSPLSSVARFCTMSCLHKAMDTYHKVEAKINMPKLFQKKDGGYEELSGCIFMAYRAITQKPLEFFIDTLNYDEVEDEFGVEFKSEDDLYHWSDYRGLYNLEAHRSIRTEDELLSLSIRSALFIVLLRYGGYFGPKTSPYGVQMSRDELHVAQIMFHIQEGIQYNLHTVDELESGNVCSGLSAPQVKEVGTSIYPTLLLLNHSCEPNTVRLCINGTQELMVAKRNIKKGEEVSDNYGIHHISMPQEDRRETLHQGFAFTCACQACEQDFPRFKSLRTFLPEDIETKFETNRDEVQELFRKGKYQEAHDLCISTIKLLQSSNTSYPHRSYEMAALSLLSCLWKLYGNQ